MNRWYFYDMLECFLNFFAFCYKTIAFIFERPILSFLYFEKNTKKMYSIQTISEI